MLDEWSGDDVDELFELLETQLGDLGIDIKYAARTSSTDEESEDDLDDDDDDDTDLGEPDDDED